MCRAPSLDPVAVRAAHIELTAGGVRAEPGTGSAYVTFAPGGSPIDAFAGASYPNLATTPVGEGVRDGSIASVVAT